jgi:hypothetical protein
MNAPESATDKSRSDRGRRGRPPRRRGKKDPPGLNAVQALKRAEPTLERVKGPAEEPLTDDEVRHLKAAFRFLREHRTTLKLRVNASEDLLLNETREPTHRGVCQHLLAKVDKTKVLGASERLAPAQATELMAGIIRFAPELTYIMRFLECVKASAGQEQASAALTHALSKMDFDDASDAQIRHILALIVDIFPESQQPVFLLSLLKTAAFRRAFDRSSEGLPPSLAGMLLPLREVHDLLHERKPGRRGDRQRRRPLDAGLLSEGALLLLRVNERCLLEFEAPVRRRLFELLSESAPEGELPKEALLSLFRSLSFRDGSERQRALFSIVSLFLRTGLEREARNLLRKEIEEQERHGGQKAKGGEAKQPAPSECQRLLRLLEQPRVGDIAIQPPRGEKPDGQARTSLPTAGRFYPGVRLSTLEPVRILWADGEQRERFVESARLWTETLLPQVALPRFFDLNEGVERPYLAMPLFDSSLSGRLKSASEQECRALALDLCRLASALSAARLCLPDGLLWRFPRMELGDFGSVI